MPSDTQKRPVQRHCSRGVVLYLKTIKCKQDKRTGPLRADKSPGLFRNCKTYEVGSVSLYTDPACGKGASNLTQGEVVVRHLPYLHLLETISTEEISPSLVSSAQERRCSATFSFKSGLSDSQPTASRVALKNGEALGRSVDKVVRFAGSQLRVNAIGTQAIDD